MRTPISIIVRDVALLNKRLAAQNSPSIRGSLERISHYAAYIERLIAGTLDVGSVTAGAQGLQLRRLDLGALLESTIGRVVSAWERRLVDLDLRSRAFVHADPIRLERVIGYLVGNSLRYGGGQRITVRLERRAPLASVSFIDTGPGWSADQLRTMFEPRETDDADGHALNLYLCKEIMESHPGGRIGVTSTPTRCTRFHFEIPTCDER